MATETGSMLDDVTKMEHVRRRSQWQVQEVSGPCGHTELRNDHDHSKWVQGRDPIFQISSVLTTREYLSQGFNAVLLQEPGRRCGPIRRASICSALLLVDSDSGSALMDPWRSFALFPRGHQDLWGTRWRTWLRHCATSRTVAGSIPDGVIWFFHLHNPSGRTMVLGSTQFLTEISTRNISWG